MRNQRANRADVPAGDSGHELASVDELEPDLAGRLRDLSRAVAPGEICELWVFPPLAGVDGSAEFFLFTRFLEEDLRGLCSARRNGRSAAPADGEPPVQTITEHGSVPADRLPRLVERFRERLGGDEEPLHFRIDGSTARWERLTRIDGEAGNP